MEIGKLLSLLTFFLLGVWRVYWYISGQEADKKKPKREIPMTLFSKRGLIKVVTLLLFGIVGVQLLGISILALPNPQVWQQILGFLVVVAGLSTAIVGRIHLGTNWANCYDYQVKPKQDLVTSGIYSYIRHPVYSGIALFFIGSELVVQSYLVFAYMLTFFVANQQAKWEEALLLKQFGATYANYINRTKRFIPFLW